MTSVLPSLGCVKSPQALEQVFQSPPVRDPTFPKKKLPCWSPATYEPGARRGNPNVRSITALVYDFDHPKDRPEIVSAHLREVGVGFVLHTTWSHRPSEPRYRVILFLSRPLKPEEYSAAWENGLRLIGYYAGVDRQARNISRHYALPAHCQGEEYISDIFAEGTPLDSDKISKAVQEEKEDPTGKLVLKRVTPVLLDGGETKTVEQVLQLGPGKYKCACPFQEDASEGSAFVRVTKDGRCFLQCTSERHTHDGSQFWLSNEKARHSPRSVADREARLAEIPSSIVEYAEKRLTYNALQGVFYRHAEGAWQISNPMRKESLLDHIIGLLPKGCDKRHAQALIDHILSRQVYGFDCQPTKDRIIRRNEVPMLNLYAWPDLVPVQGDWPRVEKLIDLICGGESKAVAWLLNWSASLIQCPNRRSMVAVLVLSPQQGIGKSMYGRLLSTIIGDGNSVVVSNRALRDNFNAHYATSLLVLADEVGIERNSTDVIAEIKACITDDRIHCSAPYAARTTVVNRMTWWMTSNRRRPLLVENDDRRFTILSPSRADAAYRKMLRECFDQKTSRAQPDFLKEIQAFAKDLASMSVDWNLISRPYSSAIKTELQNASMGSADAFICELGRRGPSALIADYPPPANYFRISDASAAKAIPCETLYGSYREWCQRKGRVDTVSETMLRLAIKDIPDISVRGARILGRRMDVYVGLKTPNEEKEGKVVPMLK
tara:strand:- start:5720 stop:7876 length:2157 start_codon:yes stop_codon:yes gene_type:complete